MCCMKFAFARLLPYVSQHLIMRSFLMELYLRETHYEPVKLLSSVLLFAIPWTVAYQVPPSIEFSRQEYWSGLSFPTPRDLPDPGIKPKSPALQADALLSHQGSPMACSHAQSGFLRFFYYYLDCTTQLVGSQFPHQGLILCPRW